MVNQNDIKNDIQNLEDELKKLTGEDFLECDQIERNAGNLTPVISFSASFQLRLAAIALKCTPADLKGLNLRQLNKILLTVNGFLLRNLDEETMPLLNSAE